MSPLLVVSRKSRLLAFTGAAVVAVAVAGCAGDGQSGLPTETPEPPATAETTPETAEPATTPAVPAVAIGEVPGSPEAAGALRAWATDLVAGADVTSRCWTVDPGHARDMYTDVDAITAAIAQPGRDGRYTVFWTTDDIRVSVLRSEIASGYACPYVSAPDDDVFTGTDAIHNVVRALARATGNPVDAGDNEQRYPLVCDGRETWDPYGTGVPGVPPLASEPDVFAEVTSFDAEAATFWAMSDEYAAVTVPVVEAGTARDLEVLVTTGANGYCLGEVS